MSCDSDRLDNLWLQTLYELWNLFKHSHKIYRKYYKNGWFWVPLRVVVLLKYEVWVWAVLTLCQYGTRTDTVSVSVYTNFFPTGKSGKILFVLFVFHVYVWACNFKFIEACNKLWAMVFPSKHKFYSSAVLFFMKNGISLSSPINVIKDHINRGPNNYGLFVVITIIQ